MNKTLAEVYKLCEESWCKVFTFDRDPDSIRPRYLEIHFGGALGRIPSLKNKKLPGKNILNPKTRARLTAMDCLYHRAAANERIVYFDNTPLLVLAVLSEGTCADTDNALATIKDWLEPPTKQVGRRKRDRGWGACITADDKHITGLAVRGKTIGMPLDFTRIIIRPMHDDIRERLITFCADAMLMQFDSATQAGNQRELKFA